MPRVKMLIMKADAAHPGKFDWSYNVTDVLKATVPAGKGWYAENQAEKPIEGGENALAAGRDRPRRLRIRGKDGALQSSRAQAQLARHPREEE